MSRAKPAAAADYREIPEPEEPPDIRAHRAGGDLRPIRWGYGPDTHADDHREDDRG